MINETMNDEKTIVNGGRNMMLAKRYRIIRRLGQGGMGSVWLAEDTQLDNRKVAIKMLPTIIVQDERAYQQLKGEALVSLKLIHPNIVTLRAFEENKGAPFLVMDYVEGQTLSDYLARKGKLSESETARLLKPIAAALDYAHKEKVVHRDVKPSNIIIRKDGHPFILDFGIAREIQESMTRVTGRTISGTLLYMSPEQLCGAAPAPAQDVYSFSAMVYECLKGEPPFTRGEIAYQIINEKPTPLSGKSRFVVSIMSGLSKKPEARPTSCFEMVSNDATYPKNKADGKDTSLISDNYWNRGYIVRAVAVIVMFLIVSVGICWLIDMKEKAQVRAAETFRVVPQTRSSLSKIKWTFYSDEYYEFAVAIRRKIEKQSVTATSGWEKVNFTFVPALAGVWNIKENTLFTNEVSIIEKEFHAINDCFRVGNFTRGELLLKQITEKEHHVYSFFKGVLAEKAGDINEARRWYREAADGWCKEALFNLGVFYEFGIGVISDLKLASAYYQRSGIMGDIEAQERFEKITCRPFSIPENGLLPISK